MPESQPRTNAASTKDLLHRHGFYTKKQFGQNFLVNDRILQQIADAVQPDEDTVVLEVGPGSGALTVHLAETAKRVVAIEKDESLRPVLADALQGYANVDVTFADCLETNLGELMAPYLDASTKLVFAANLPYYITTPILFQVLESSLPLTRAVVMVQKEVADRMVATPGGKDYGVLSVGIQYRATVKRLFTVPPSAFLPQPGVDSAVVLLDCTVPVDVHVDDEQLFFRVVRAAFSTRRKTLLNALSNGLGKSKDVCREWIVTSGIQPEARAETLSIHQFAELANRFPHA
ncbi:16S rRNA (adenine(1518)-N(6)/adenine(1519)-N(6))-dimethyltransferase RsmA [Alicyclobacillus dauci]|uniref:Ribosomal RNA small subunit methyltransferase A n=1 Tax=Alicyclobacillus dauci TaxID=1475485 RepID=A0ABY6Z358_9BACL|nr:16S rRNA (adenine(1518)-N(6)/adenine(1519)-N(6))-dimethyltransferase RsmA [Alicyclobacillus dauci]WAH37317.1 16S rRNA (adenine(1518)-N(6)/adenine(1519)-N(6))-dimethyltransferase RsmA [Alicyclobacillus dauci]